jgi:hypothetical protein
LRLKLPFVATRLHTTVGPAFIVRNASPSTRAYCAKPAETVL